MRWVHRVVPEPWRSRFEPEIDEALASSESPLRDRIDLITWGVRLRVESRARTLVIAGTILITVGAASTAWAAGELTDGIVELPRHWWSTLACLPAIVGLALLVAAALQRPPLQK